MRKYRPVAHGLHSFGGKVKFPHFQEDAAFVLMVY